KEDSKILIFVSSIVVLFAFFIAHGLHMLHTCFHMYILPGATRFVNKQRAFQITILQCLTKTQNPFLNLQQDHT
ncbi:hypothetical protein ACJX0J_031341, partial [Zea mays]